MKKIFSNKYVIFITSILIFFFSFLFQIIPIMILNLDVNKINAKQEVVLNLFSNIVIVFILLFIYRKSIKEDLKKFKDEFFKIFETAFQIWVVGLALMAIFNILINMFSPNDIANNEEAIRSMISVNPIFMLLNTALLAPIIEELVFRKSFRIIFKNDIIFVLTSGIIFGGLHVIFAIENVFDFLYLLPYCSLGISFSYMYYKTDNICAPIFMHMLHNGIITILNIFALGMILC